MHSIATSSSSADAGPPMFSAFETVTSRRAPVTRAAPPPAAPPVDTPSNIQETSGRARRSESSAAPIAQPQHLLPPIPLPHPPIAPAPAVGAAEAGAVEEEDPDAQRQHRALPTFLLSQLLFSTEEEHGTHTTHTSYALPLWFLVLGFLAWVCATSMYSTFVKELAHIQPVFQTMTGAGTAAACANFTYDRSFASCPAGSSPPDDVACQEAGAAMNSGSWAGEVVANSWVSYCSCTRLLPSTLAPLCVAPFPVGLPFHLMLRPIESWALPATMLEAPRLGSLYVLRFAAHYGAGELLRSSWFWFLWLSAPHAAAAGVASACLYRAHPVAGVLFVMLCVRAQVTEWRHLISGPRGVVLFFSLDSFMIASLYLLLGLFLPTLLLNLVTIFYWSMQIQHLVLSPDWFSEPLGQPLSKALLQHLAQYFFSVWRQEVESARYANYPLNYQCSSTPSEELRCCICYDNKLDTALIPCCHVVCKPCAHRLPRSECPYCATAFRYMQFVRL